MEIDFVSFCLLIINIGIFLHLFSSFTHFVIHPRRTKEAAPCSAFYHPHILTSSHPSLIISHPITNSANRYFVSSIKCVRRKKSFVHQKTEKRKK